MKLYYELGPGHKPVPCDAYVGNTPHVGDTKVGDVRVSTVFLSVNHQWEPGPPILFETMVFGGKHDDFQERYETWEQAKAGHQRAVEMVKTDT